MLLRAATLEAIAAGAVTVAFRRWRRPTVKAGGTLTTRVGVLAIDAVEPVSLDDLTDEDARRAGHASRDEVVAMLAGREGTVHRVTFHLAGEDPRVALREHADLDPGERAELAARLARLDARPDGPWTERVPRLIGDRPGGRAAELAAELGRERLAFKADVRKLKALGLTESLPTGYRLSPRGRAWLAR